MSKPNNYDDGDRKGKLVHHSGRGKMPRNAGNFTRGSQLITHEYMMWFGSVKIPLIVWALLFILSFSITTFMVLKAYELQMILMRIYASAWLAMSFDPGKIINLTNASGSVLPAPIEMIKTHPDVIYAWDRFMRCFWGSSFMAAFVAAPLTIWYVGASHKRGKGILEERHQRGAMLVDAPELAASISAHNQSEFQREADARFPNLTTKQVLALPFEKRKLGGIHHPYTLAGIPYPWRSEQSHTMLVGTTGTGKTTQMRAMIKQMRKRRDRAIVFDLTGAYVEAFYNPETDTILNPMDQRCPSWSIFHDCKNHADFNSAAAALIPIDGGTSDTFWQLAARTLFVEACIKLQERGLTTNRALAENLMLADLKSIHKMLEGTMADPLTAPDVARMAISILAVVNTNAQALRLLPEDNEPFSITDWVEHIDNPGGILFITSTHNELTLNRALLTLWMNTAVHKLMRMPRTRDLRTWFFFDEVHALHRLPAIEDGLQTARGFGGAFVLGIHSFAKLSETYGEDGAKNLASLARTKLILATADRETAEHCSDYIGQREVRMMDEAYSYGYSNIRDASTITPRHETQPLVIPDDIMKLPSLRGFLVFPEGFDAARVKLEYVDYPVVAPGYILRENVKPISFAPKGTETEPEEEAGGREGNVTPEPATQLQTPSIATNSQQPSFRFDQDEATQARQSEHTEISKAEAETATDKSGLIARSLRLSVQKPEQTTDQNMPQTPGPHGPESNRDDQQQHAPNPPSRTAATQLRRELEQSVSPELKVERAVSSPDIGGSEPSLDGDIGL